MNRKAGIDKVVILDRDGTIVVDRGYLNDPAGLEFEPRAAEGLKWLHAHRYRLIVVTNQSGVGRGYFPLERVHAMNARLTIMVQDLGAHLEAIYFCPHAPEQGCICRKPELGLLTRAANELGFDPASAIVIGDKASDIEFGRRAGATTILLSSVRPGDGFSPQPDLVALNLMEAALAVTSIGHQPQ